MRYIPYQLFDKLPIETLLEAHSPLRLPYAHANSGLRRILNSRNISNRVFAQRQFGAFVKVLTGSFSSNSLRNLLSQGIDCSIIDTLPNDEIVPLLAYAKAQKLHFDNAIAL